MEQGESICIHSKLNIPTKEAGILEINAAIKSELKAAGYSAKDFRITVKDSLYGGNTYVFVEYDLHAFDDLPTEYMERATAIMGDMDRYDGRQIAQNADGASLHLLQDGYRYRLIEVSKTTRQQTTFLYGVSDLAIALFRFSNLGTAAA